MDFWTRLFVCVGIVTVSVFVHEGVHLLEAVNPHQVCIGLDGDRIARVEAKSFRTSGEWFAYSVQGVFAIMVAFFVARRNY